MGTTDGVLGTGAVFLTDVRRLRVIAAFLPAARRFRVVAAFLAAVRRFRVAVAFRAADVPIGPLLRIDESSIWRTFPNEPRGVKTQRRVGSMRVNASADSVSSYLLSIGRPTSPGPSYRCSPGA